MNTKVYFPRLIDDKLQEWKNQKIHKPVLLRGARQVGKSSAVRHLGQSFDTFVEVNFERNPEIKEIFQRNLDVRRIVSQLSIFTGCRIEEGKCLLFLDEIQQCPEAVMSLRFFKEDMPELHIIGAGSLLEFALEELPTFGVGRIHSMFMYPMTFDEFLIANGEGMLLEARRQSSLNEPLPDVFHDRLVELFRIYVLVGGMPEVVVKWSETMDYIQCQEIQNDIIMSYEDDFPKYRKRVDPQLLRQTLRSVVMQVGSKFVYSQVGGGYRTEDVKKALDMLVLAGLCIPVVKTSANGLPLGAEADYRIKKILFLDSGLMLRALSLWMGEDNQSVRNILTQDVTELVNRGGLAEMVAGLEMRRYGNPNLRTELFYWMREAKNSMAEIDYVTAIFREVVPVEVKSGGKGGMKSLWSFMREKKLKYAVRSSLEKSGIIEYTDKEQNDDIRKVVICPLYAISQMSNLLEEMRLSNKDDRNALDL